MEEQVWRYERGRRSKYWLVKMIRKNAFVDIVLVYLLLFTSGSVLYKQSSGKFLILAFMVSFIAWFLYSDRKLNEKFILYVSIFVGFILLVSIYTSGSLGVGFAISSAIKLVFAYLVLRTVGSRFIETYIKVIALLAAISLFGYLSDQLHLFGSLIRRLPRLTDVGYEGIFYLFRYFYQGYTRNNSIFFEPGAYQIFLNAALFMLFFTKTGFSGARRWVYVILFLVTLLTTYSTTGFLIFAVMLGLLLIKSEVVSTSGKLALVGVLLGVVSIFSAQFYGVVIEKIGKYTSIQDITNIKSRRSYDALVDIAVFKRNVFGLGYRNYYKEFSSIGLTSESSASKGSNGVTKMFAVFGLPFSLFYFGSYYWAFRKLLRERGWLTPTVCFGMFLIFLFSEAWYMFAPCCLAIIAAAFIYERTLQDDKEL